MITWISIGVVLYLIACRMLLQEENVLHVKDIVLVLLLAFPGILLWPFVAFAIFAAWWSENEIGDKVVWERNKPVRGIDDD